MDYYYFESKKKTITEIRVVTETMLGLRNLPRLLTRADTTEGLVTQLINVIKDREISRDVQNPKSVVHTLHLPKLLECLFPHPRPLLETKGSARNAHTAEISVIRLTSVVRKGGERHNRKTRHRLRTRAHLRRQLGNAQYAP